jgi:hypothetical protein
MVRSLTHATEFLYVLLTFFLFLQCGNEQSLDSISSNGDTSTTWKWCYT